MSWYLWYVSHENHKSSHSHPITPISHICNTFPCKPGVFQYNNHHYTGHGATVLGGHANPSPEVGTRHTYPRHPFSGVHEYLWRSHAEAAYAGSDPFFGVHVHMRRRMGTCGAAMPRQPTPDQTQSSAYTSTASFLRRTWIPVAQPCQDSLRRIRPNLRRTRLRAPSHGTKSWSELALTIVCETGESNPGHRFGSPVSHTIANASSDGTHLTAQVYIPCHTEIFCDVSHIRVQYRQPPCRLADVDNALRRCF